MRSGAWTVRALSPVLLPRWLCDSGARPGHLSLQRSVRFVSTESPSTALPAHARVVICGGGIVGTSVAYHLAKLGWTEIVLLEQGRWVFSDTHDRHNITTVLKVATDKKSNCSIH